MGAAAVVALCAGVWAQNPSPPAPSVPPQNQPLGPAIAPAAPVDVVGATEGNTVGLLDAGDLGDDLWSGSQRGRLVDLLQDGALATADPAARDLARRIVLTRADAPDGEAKRTLISVRIEQLLKAGLIDEAGQLAAKSRLDDADFARVQANALLYGGRSEAVCADQTATRLTSGELFWVELRAYCAAIAGDDTLTELTMAALGAMGGDPAFATLFEDVTEHKILIPTEFPQPTALHAYLLRQLNLPLPAALAQAGGVPENLFVATDKRVPPAVRLAAAERIVRTGALSGTDLRAILDAQPFNLAQAANAQALADNAPFLAAQALLRHMAKTEIQPARKLRLMRLALARGAKENLLALTAAVQGDILNGLVPVAGEDPGPIARALLLADNAGAAAWLPGDDALQTAAALLAADPAKATDLNARLRDYAGQLANPQMVHDPYKALILGMAAALDRLPAGLAEPGRDAQYPDGYPGRRLSATAQLQLQTAAATPGRHGEALLILLNQIRPGWADLAPETGVKAVRLLRGMGLPKAAEAFAREALLLYAPPPPAPIAAAPIAAAAPAP